MKIATSHLLLGCSGSEIWDRWEAGEPTVRSGAGLTGSSPLLSSGDLAKSVIRPPDTGAGASRRRSASSEPEEISSILSIAPLRCGRSRATWDDLRPPPAGEVQRSEMAARIVIERLCPIRLPGIVRDSSKVLQAGLPQFLRSIVIDPLQRYWVTSSRLPAGWCCCYPVVPQKQVSHEMIYRSLFIQSAAC